MTTIPGIDREQRRPRALGLVALLFGLALGAATLQMVAGPPRLPGGPPTWDSIITMLRGSELSLDTVASSLTTAAWAIWLWIAASLVLRLLLVVVDMLTGGATWVRVLRALSDRVTLPMVRRVTDGALVAVLVVYLVGRSPATAAAASLSPATIAFAAASPDPAGPATAPASGQPQDEQSVDYTVQPGDTLWALSERFYGSGHEYPRLVAANAGRAMPDGGRFTYAGVLRPGWVLQIPLASPRVENPDGYAYHTVETGDTLHGIAARLLGDAARWPEIFDLNRGTAALGDGRTLTDPDLLWPALRLRLPLTAPANAVERPVSPPQPAPMSVPATASPTPRMSAEPIPTPPSPTPAATMPSTPSASSLPSGVPVPAAVAEPQSTSDGAPAALIYGAAGLAAIAAAGGAALLVRRVRRSLSEPPIPPPARPRPPDDEFAEVELSRALTHRLHGDEVEPVVLLAGHLHRFLEDNGIGRPSVLLACRGRSAVTLVLRAGLSQHARIVELARKFGARLGATGRVSVTSDQDIALQLSGLNAAGLLAPFPDRPDRLPPLLPIGITPNGETLSANWRELGHVLVAGLPGDGVEVTLTSLIAALTARCRPEELHLWTVARRRSLPDRLLALPHQRGAIEPDDARVSHLLGQLRAEVVRRMQRVRPPGEGEWRPRPGEPELVLVIGELDELEDDGTTLELIGGQGAALGVRLVAGTTRVGTADADVWTPFATRLALQTLDDEESVRLVGQPDAADLGSGESLLRIDGRTPVRLRGFSVSAEHLDELTRLMEAAYGGHSVGPEAGTGHTNAGEAGIPPVALGEEVASAAGTENDAKSESSRTGEPSAVWTGAVADRVGDEAQSQLADPDASAAEATAVEYAPAEEGRPSERSAGDHQRGITGEWVGGAAAHAAGEPAAPPPACSTNGETGAPCQHLGPLIPDGSELGPAGDGAGEGSGTSVLLQVRCFGEFTVTSGERELTPTGEEGASYKAWEVLAFLAAHPEGAVSKEKLLAAVWPDVDPERAGNRMRVAMARLRALLARQVPGLTAEVVRCERDGTCRLDAAVVWSDVQQFSARCRAAAKLASAEGIMAFEEACALYSGDLLAGRGARFYEWVDERDASGLSLRERYREEYYRAMQRLAQLYRGAGEPARALLLYKRLLKAEPTLEDIVRGLYRCYEQQGDLSSLIREDRHLRQALREAYYDPEDPEDDPEHYQPEPETVELFNRIRALLEARTAVRAGRGDHGRAGGG